MIGCGRLISASCDTNNLATIGYLEPLSPLPPSAGMVGIAGRAGAVGISGILGGVGISGIAGIVILLNMSVNPSRAAPPSAATKSLDIGEPASIHKSEIQMKQHEK